jgi:hypothetical protein
VIGVSEDTNNYVQSSSTAINLRGSNYTNNQMTSANHSPILLGHILTCCIDFDKDSFTITGNNNMFHLKNTKSIKGRTLYPFVELYYSNTSLSFVSDDY